MAMASGIKAWRLLARTVLWNYTAGSSMATTMAISLTCSTLAPSAGAPSAAAMSSEMLAPKLTRHAPKCPRSGASRWPSAERQHGRAAGRRSVTSSFEENLGELR